MRATDRISFIALLGAVLLLTAGALVGCAPPPVGTAPPAEEPTPATDLDQIARELNDMEQRWQEQGITDYSFEFEWRCFCPPGYREPVRITVMDGRIESAGFVDPETEATLPGEEEYRTIDGLFGLIRDAVKQGAHEIEVAYGEERGFPVSADIDYDALTIDEERGFRVRNFQPGETDGDQTMTPTEERPIEQPQAEGVVASDVQRRTSPDVDGAELAELVSGNTRFAFDLYHAVRGGNDNLFYSPYSISMALAMTYVGARGETAEQMADALHFTLPEERLHPAFNALGLELAERGKGPMVKEGDAFRLNVVNALWGQAGYTFLPDFLDALAANYGAGMRLLDFRFAPEESRQTINEWVADQTEGKIENLIPPGAITDLTRLVLTNAIYFNATWLHTFDEANTAEGPFHLLGGTEVTVPMMHQTEYFNYTADDGYQAVELPYAGEDLSMVILLPAQGQFESFEDELGAGRVDAIVQDLERENVKLTMPEFEFDSSFQLSGALAGLGMPIAFDAEQANFSGIADTDDLFIQEVVHKAFVSVDEEGTEAAAATGVMMGITSAPPPPEEVAIDRPFIFMIRDVETEAILFAGRVLNPVS